MASQIFQFIMNAGPVPGKKFILDKNEIFIGRDVNSNVLVNDAEVSRNHARLLLQAGGYVIEDLGSTNGTFINGQRLVGLRTLLPGDTIMIGDNVSLSFEVKQPDLDAPRVSTTTPDAGSIQQADHPASPVSAPTPTRKTWQPAETPISGQPSIEQVVLPSQSITPQQVGQAPRETFVAPTVAPIPSREVQPIYPEVDATLAPAPVKTPPSLPAKKRSGPNWLLITVISLLFILCMVVFGALWYIDSHYLWCNLLPFLQACG
jgi:pSer/pThr/pTyr-binding forkhead associated (FHA) protein